jgi:hypothetical protein
MTITGERNRINIPNLILFLLFIVIPCSLSTKSSPFGNRQATRLSDHQEEEATDNLSSSTIFTTSSQHESSSRRRINSRRQPADSSSASVITSESADLGAGRRKPSPSTSPRVTFSDPIHQLSYFTPPSLVAGGPCETVEGNSSVSWENYPDSTTKQTSKVKGQIRETATRRTDTRGVEASIGSGDAVGQTPSTSTSVGESFDPRRRYLHRVSQVPKTTGYGFTNFPDTIA